MSFKGSLEVISGCMYSGKTEELMRRIRTELIGGKYVQVFRSRRSATSKDDMLISHIGRRIAATVIQASSAVELAERLQPGVHVIAIDDVHFFDNDVVNLCNTLANSGKRVLVAGLDLDFRGEPFPGPIAGLMATADQLDKLAAICNVCGEPAYRTQRLVGRKPSKWDETLLKAGENEVYHAVCRLHHHIDKPTSQEV
jgi:thymidine kinase